MKHFSIDLLALSPLAIRSDHAPGRAEATKFISGTTLVGSLAAAHRLLYPTQKDDFEELFLSGQIHYPNLYPALFSKQPGMQGLNLPVYPIPKTAQSCKRHPGFSLLPDKDNDAHDVRDSLFDWALFKLSSANGEEINTAALEVFQEHKFCKNCPAMMDHFSGYYCSFHTMMAAQVNTRLQTHTGIDRASGTVQEGILYSRQVFEEDMHFWGMVKLPDNEKLVEKFTTFMHEVSTKELVRVGTGRSRGLGKVKLDIEALEDDDKNKRDELSQRLEAFNTALKERANVALQDFYFALTLHAPVILRDNLLRYQGHIDAETLQTLTGIPATSIYQAASMRRISGWQELWGTPRTNEYAIETGSVFLFSCPGLPNDRLPETLLNALLKLEEEGIGERRAEGFGRVCISDAFHQKIDQEKLPK